MIRRMETAQPLASLPDNALAGYLKGLGEAYGVSRDFLRFYEDERGSVLALMDGTATVRCLADSFEEAALFLQAQPEITFLRTERAFAEFWQKNGGKSAVFRSVMVCDQVISRDVTTEELSPRDLYPLLSDVFHPFPPFEEWYLDVSYRTRHGFCRNRAVTVEGRAVASAMTVTEWQGGAVIGAVATDAAHRRKGYASACVSSLAAQLQAEGKRVFICPKTESAKNLYESLGFSVCGELALIERN